MYFSHCTWCREYDFQKSMIWRAGCGRVGLWSQLHWVVQQLCGLWQIAYFLCASILIYKMGVTLQSFCKYQGKSSNTQDTHMFCMFVRHIHRKVVKEPAFLYVYSYSHACFKEVVVEKQVCGGTLDRSWQNIEVLHGLGKPARCSHDTLNMLPGHLSQFQKSRVCRLIQPQPPY